MDSQGRPAITFYDADAGKLQYAMRGDDGSWMIETVDPDGANGRYSLSRF